MLKILIASNLATPKLKRFETHINDSLQAGSLYASVHTLIVYPPKIQQEDLMAQKIQKELATPNVNV